MRMINGVMYSRACLTLLTFWPYFYRFQIAKNVKLGTLLFEKREHVIDSLHHGAHHTVTRLVPHTLCQSKFLTLILEWTLKKFIFTLTKIDFDIFLRFFFSEISKTNILFIQANVYSRFWTLFSIVTN